MKTKYTISETSELLGVTTHMLRHYEKMGIIHPETNPENGYRYYSVIDTRRFNLSREYLACGISLEQCAQIMSRMEEKDIEQIIDAAVAEQNRRIVLSHIAIRFLKHVREMNSMLPDLVGKVWVEELSRKWRIEFSNNERVTMKPSLLKQQHIWLSCLPAVYWTGRIKREELQSCADKLIAYKYGLMCFEEDALALGFEKTENVEIIPGGEYLSMVYEKADPGPFTAEHLNGLMNYINNRRIDIDGDFFSHILASKEVDGIIRNYHRVYVRIKK